jgi:hypothetical protein
MVLYNHTQLPSGEVMRNAVVNPNNGQTLTRPLRDPIEIFTSRKNEIAEQQTRQQELIRKAEAAWNYFDQNTPATERYNVSLSAYITRDYFIQNLYPCSHPTCRRRFPTEDEAKKHALRYCTMIASIRKQGKDTAQFKE